MPTQDGITHVPKKKKKVKKMPRKLTEDDYDADGNLDMSSPDKPSRMSLINEEDETAQKKYRQPQDLGDLPDLELD